MYTECPSCQTFFKITPNQLKAAGGRVRCGNCNEVFSALDGLVDVIPEDIVGAEKAGLPKEEKFSRDEPLSQPFSELDVSSEPVAENEKSAVSKIEELNESLAGATDADADGSMSFADVEIPGMSGVAAEEAELALESILLSEPQSGLSESKSTAEQEEINQDIDAALDGLFDGNTEISASDDVLGTASSLEIDAQSGLSSISELDDLQDLDFGDLGKEGVNEQSLASTESDALTQFSKSRLDTSLDEVKSKKAGKDDEISSLSEFEKEIGQLSNIKVSGIPGSALDESSFDLGDSFLDSETFDGESDAKIKAKATKESEVFSGDSFILEELDEEKTSSGGVIAKTAWVFVIFLLLGVLLGEFAYLKRQDLAMYPALKPVIENLCMNLNKVYPCEISPARDVAAIELLERNVVSHPNAKNALLITSTIENKAEFDQPFPNLILTFSDINQKIIAKRKFAPAEYLSKDVDIEGGMKSKVPLKLMLEIVDPGEEAVNFEFNFQ